MVLGNLDLHHLKRVVFRAETSGKVKDPCRFSQAASFGTGLPFPCCAEVHRQTGRRGYQVRHRRYFPGAARSIWAESAKKSKWGPILKMYRTIRNFPF